MRKFQEMCQEEFGKIELMARGGQKIVFDGVHNSYGETVIKLYFQLNDPRSIREIQIEKGLSLSMVPKIYETGIIEYEGTETLYIIEQKVKGTELRKVLESGRRFSLDKKFYKNVLKPMGADAVILPNPVISVSSTFIRDNLDEFDLISGPHIPERG